MRAFSSNFAQIVTAVAAAVTLLYFFRGVLAPFFLALVIMVVIHAIADVTVGLLPKAPRWIVMVLTAVVLVQRFLDFAHIALDSRETGRRFSEACARRGLDPKQKRRRFRRVAAPPRSCGSAPKIMRRRPQEDAGRAELLQEPPIAVLSLFKGLAVASGENSRLPRRAIDTVHGLYLLGSKFGRSGVGSLFVPKYLIIRKKTPQKISPTPAPPSQQERDSSGGRRRCRKQAQRRHHPAARRALRQEESGRRRSGTGSFFE